jgi:uncharacterized integral membrane protein
MSFRTPFLIILLCAIALFAALNWPVFTAPTTLSLLVTTVEAPLGVIMLGLVVLLTVVFMLFAAYLQTATLLESRKHAKEIQTQRKLADSAEGSRIVELQQLLSSNLMKLEQQSQEARSAAIARIDRLEQELRIAISHESAGLAAQIAELEDRINRQEAKPKAFRTE